MTGVTSILAVILQRQLAVRDEYIPLSECAAIVTAMFDGASVLAEQGLTVRRGVCLVETEGPPA